MTIVGDSFVLPPVVPGVRVMVSASTYVQYMRCPEQAGARLRGIFPEDSVASFRGVLAHRIFARHLERGEVPASDFTQACKEEIGAGLNPKMVSLGLRPGQVTSVINEVQDIYKRFTKLGTTGFSAAEVRIDVEPWDDVGLRGVIDATFIDETVVRLVDWKTGALGDAGHQMDFYALLWWLDRDALPDRIEAVSVKTGEQVASVPTLDDVHATAARVAQLVTSYRTAETGDPEMERFAGPWCCFCPVLAACPEGASAVAIASA